MRRVNTIQLKETPKEKKDTHEKVFRDRQYQHVRRRTPLAHAYALPRRSLTPIPRAGYAPIAGSTLAWCE